MVVLTSAALIINPITFPSAPVMKVKATKAWFGCLGNRSKCITPLGEHSLPSCLAATGPFTYLVCTGHWSSNVLPISALYCISLHHQWGVRLMRIWFSSSGYSRGKHWAFSVKFSVPLICVDWVFLCLSLPRKFPLKLSPLLLYPCALSILSLWNEHSTFQKLIS